jgi:hypothetical protein
MVPYCFVGRLSIWMAIHPEVVVVTMGEGASAESHISMWTIMQPNRLQRLQVGKGMAVQLVLVILLTSSSIRFAYQWFLILTVSLPSVSLTRVALLCQIL